MAEEAGNEAPAGNERRRWEDRFTEAGSRVEEELRRVVRYIDNEVVPEICRNGSSALRHASTELERLAQYLEDHRGEGTGPKP